MSQLIKSNVHLQINLSCCWMFACLFLWQFGGKDIDDSHEAAMFGAGGTVSQVTPSSTAAALPDVKTTPQPVMTQSVDKEGLFASWVREFLWFR